MLKFDISCAFVAEWPEEVYRLKKFPAVLVKWAAMFCDESFSDFLGSWGTIVLEVELWKLKIKKCHQVCTTNIFWKNLTSLFWLPEALVLELKSLETCKLLDPTVKDEFDVGNFILCISLCEKKHLFYLDFFIDYFLDFFSVKNSKQYTELHVNKQKSPIRPYKMPKLLALQIGIIWKYKWCHKI